MSRFFIDNDPIEREGQLYFRVLIEEGSTSRSVSETEFAELLGVEAVSADHLKEGALFEHGNHEPTGHMTEAQKKLLDSVMKQLSQQLPPVMPE